MQAQGLTEALAAWFVGVAWFLDTLEHSAALLPTTKGPWEPVPKLTLSVKLEVSYFSVKLQIGKADSSVAELGTGTQMDR